MFAKWWTISFKHKTGLPRVSWMKAFSFVRKPRKPERWKIICKVDESGIIWFKVGFLYIMCVFWCIEMIQFINIVFCFFKHDFCPLSEAHIFDDQVLGILILVLPCTCWVTLSEILVLSFYLAVKWSSVCFMDLNMFLKHQ